jgi:hypothetical protein
MELPIHGFPAVLYRARIRGGSIHLFLVLSAAHNNLGLLIHLISAV